MAGERRPRLPALTSLRFFAAAVVVAFHYRLHGRSLPIDWPALKGWVGSGYQAVGFFFVLSGFILYYVHGTRAAASGMNVGVGRFWRARAARILPTYYLALLIALPSFIHYAFQTHVVSIFRFKASLFFTPTLLQAWFPPVSLSWNGPAWSLSVEAFFYTLFPLLALVLRRGPALAWVAGAFVLALAEAFLHAQLMHIPGSEAWGYFRFYFPPFHLPQFLFGMALGRIYLERPPLGTTARALAFWLGVAGLAVTLGLRARWPEWSRADPILLVFFGLVVLGGAVAPRRGFHPLAWAPAVLLGEASYAVYLLHEPLRYWWNTLTLKLDLALPIGLDFALYALLCVFAAVACFVWIETPGRRWLTRLAAPPKARPPLAQPEGALDASPP